MGKPKAKWLSQAELTDAMKNVGEKADDAVMQVARITGRLLSLWESLREVHPEIIEDAEKRWVELMNPDTKDGYEKPSVGDEIAAREVRPVAGDFGRSDENESSEGGD